MTNPDFAELKEKLTTFDDHKSQASMPRLYEHIDRVDLWITAQKKQYAQSSVIISELIEIIKSQSEALESCGCFCGSFDFDKLACISCSALSETNTRLQKLREFK